VKLYVKKELLGFDALEEYLEFENYVLFESNFLIEETKVTSIRTEKSLNGKKIDFNL